MTQTTRTFLVRRDNGPDFRFEGQLLGFVDSTLWLGRWTQFALFKSKAGLYICSKTLVSIQYGERDIYLAVAVGTVKEVHEFFGYCDLAKELYEQANIQQLTLKE